MGTRRLVIWGAGGHAISVTEVVERNGDFWILAYLDDLHPERHGTLFCGQTVFGGQGHLAMIKEADVKHMIIAVGDNEERMRLAQIALEHHFELPVIVHSRAVVGRDVSIGAGTVIMAGVVVNPRTRIGDNVIINTGATVDHECRIGDGAHIAPGAHLGGNVMVGEGAFVGIGAVVAQNLLVGYKAIVGAGSVVVKDVPYKTVVYGNPARVVRPARPDDFARLAR